MLIITYLESAKKKKEKKEEKNIKQCTIIIRPLLFLLRLEYGWNPTDEYEIKCVASRFLLAYSKISCLGRLIYWDVKYCACSTSFAQIFGLAICSMRTTGWHYTHTHTFRRLHSQTEVVFVV